MGSLLCFAIIALQLTNSLAIDFMPLKCFFTRNNFLINHDPSIINDSSGDHPFSNAFDILKFDYYSINKDGWMLETRNAEILGLGEAVLDKQRINYVTKIFELTFTTDYLLRYDYRTSGYLFSRPIEGEGILDITLDKTQIGVSIPFEFQKIDGEEYAVLKDFNVWYIIGDAEYRFSNLYYGDKKSSDEMHTLINNNWEYVTTHFMKSYMERISEEIFKVFKTYLLNHPVKDIAKC